MGMEVLREKERRPKIRCLDSVRDDIKEKGLSREVVYDRPTFNHISSHIDPT